ncbi:exodeoxyribonuclease VII small subunit [uncultured Ezakiella sp.]|uniref:exodeoxyribonuclease VII small subunit n=1 Tax=uncultured Ezakiella sp. TaxID=1637529 RepID=UPI0025FA9ACA|nr:exodeoxyribonuclease VII small subunit [uncultured Ezakiella sp.]
MENFNYEAGIKRINEIIELLESDEIALNESYNLFLEAKNLIKKCENYIDECEKNFEILIEEDNYESEDDIEF